MPMKSVVLKYEHRAAGVHAAADSGCLRLVEPQHGFPFLHNAPARHSVTGALVHSPPHSVTDSAQLPTHPLASDAHLYIK